MRQILALVLMLAVLTLLGCQPINSLPPASTPQLVDENVANNLPQAAPTHPAITPTATILSEPVELIATVWEELPQVPILMYHRFDPRPGSASTRFTTSLTEFDQHLQALYDAGFSLVSLSDWLRGDIHLQEGRRPLIITIDDLFFADQISLDESGQPAPYSGVGRLWAFTQAHPQFNFSVALFYNLGDKGYANHYANGVFNIQEGWQEARARAIAWGIENGALPMNHTYEHPFLNTLTATEIQWQLEENDRELRHALALIGREDLNKTLPNILAPPYVVKPDTEEGQQVLYNYINPEGAPVAAIIMGDHAAGPRLLQAPFAHDFIRWHIHRISASSQSVSSIIAMINQIPTVSSCDLGQFQGNPHISPDDIGTAILKQVNTGNCPYGYYVVNRLAFYVQQDVIIQYAP